MKNENLKMKNYCGLTFKSKGIKILANKLL